MNILVDAYYNYLDHVSVRPKKARGGSSSKFPKNTWYNDECRSMRRKVKDFSKMYDLSLELNRVTYFKLKRDYRRVVQRTKRKAKEKKKQEFDTLLQVNNNTAFWKAWKLIQGTNYVNVSLSEFFIYFQTQSVPPHNDDFDYDNMQEIEKFISEYNFSYGNEPMDAALEMLLDAPISTQEIAIALNRLKSNKAAGSDGVPSEFLKCGGPDMIDILNILFNCV